VQEAVEVLGPGLLAAVISRQLAARKSSNAASLGFTTRLELGPAPTALAPASDAASDLQLSILLFLIAVCDGDGERYKEVGLELLAQQVREGTYRPPVDIKLALHYGMLEVTPTRKDACRPTITQELVRPCFLNFTWHTLPNHMPPAHRCCPAASTCACASTSVYLSWST
jgi:hypothetical protein